MWSLKRFSGIGFESGEGSYVWLLYRKTKSPKDCHETIFRAFLCGFFDDLAGKVPGGTITFHSGDLDIGGQTE